MKVRELIALLENCGKDEDVIVDCDGYREVTSIIDSTEYTPGLYTGTKGFECYNADKYVVLVSKEHCSQCCCKEK